MNAQNDEEPVWVKKQHIKAIHRMLIERFGGSHEVKESADLEMALDRPKNKYHYGDPTLWELAAAYAVGIVKNHPFNDGNKRAAITALSVFLEMNGFCFRAEESEVVLMMEALAKNELSEDMLASWIEQNAHTKKEA